MATTAPPALASSPSHRPQLPAALLKPLCLWHLCSLDAPTVAVVWTGAFAWVAHRSVPSWWWVAVACSVWAVYVGDRLLDAKNGGHDLQVRHAFHWRFRKLFIPGALTAAAVAGCLLLARLPRIALRGDCVVAAAAAIYFSGVHSRPRFPAWLARIGARAGIVSRECVVGILFTAGCALPVWPLHPAAATWNSVRTSLATGTGLPVLFFAVLAWLNVSSITCWEAQPPRRRRPWIPALALAAAGMLGALALMAGHPRSAWLLLAGALSALMLAALDQTRLDPVLRRAAADFVLLTPALILPFAQRIP